MPAERDLFGEAIWDVKAFPRDWVERMETIIYLRYKIGLAQKELEWRCENNVRVESERPMKWKEACDWSTHGPKLLSSLSY